MTEVNKKYSVVLICTSIVMLLLVWPLPNPLFEVPYSTILRDSNGRLMAGKIAQDGQWRFPANDKVPDKFETSLLLFEDEHFYDHPGVNPLSMARALWQNITERRVVSGGSTLTMQLTRMMRDDRKRSIGNKLIEMFLAVKVELHLSKKEILAHYTAMAPFGGNVVGLEAATWRYYGRRPDQLSWAEAATLAVLPNNPSMIFPGKNHEILRAKRDRLLDKIHLRGHITRNELTLAKAEPLPEKPNAMPSEAQHLLTRVISEGIEGQQIATTLDFHLQKNVLKKVKNHYEQLSANEIHNAAAIVLDASSGEVLAYVGNSPTEVIHSPHVDIITAPRSTGSILKPLLYGMAVEDGVITPDQLLPDIPTFFQGFAPKNFDNSYEGAVGAGEALQKSLNIPFVHLLREYTYEQFHKNLRDLGMTTLQQSPGHYGLSLILGGAEASLWDLTAIYAGMVRTLENYYRLGPEGDYQKGVLFENTFRKDDPVKEVNNNFLSAGAIWWMFKGMQELQRPEYISSWKQFASSRNIAWKTGTSFGHRDAWAIGTDGKYVVGTWAGNADGEGRPGLTGVQAAAPLMFDIFDLLPKGKEFPKSVPAEMEYFSTCSRSGFLAGLHCDVTERVPLPAKASQAIACPYHMLVHLDDKKQLQVNADCYPQSQIETVSWFKLPPVQSWYYRFHNSDYEEIPDFRSGCLTSVPTSQMMEMIYPRHTTKIYIPVELDGKTGRCVFEATHVNPEATIYWHLNEEYIGKTSGNHQMSLFPDGGKHTLRLVDNEGYDLTMTFEVLSERRI